MTEYLIGATLRIRATSVADAKDRATRALLSLASDEVCGAWIDREARLFEPDAFAQIPGQMPFESAE